MPTSPLDLFKQRIAIVKATVSPAELAAPDKAKNKWFKEPGLFEVFSSGFVEFTKKDKSGTYNAIAIKDASGREAQIFPYLLDRDKKPDPFKMQRLLRGFGFTWTQKQIGLFWTEIMAMLPDLLVGNVMVQLSYYGYNVWYEEKGKYSIRDFSKGAADFPNNQMKDPVNGDFLFFGDEGEAIKYMQENSMKNGDKRWDFLRPAESFEMTETQVAVCQLIEDMLSAEAPAVVEAPPEPEKPKPAKPAWAMKK